MRARSRRNASDYVAAALLELMIMGAFVLIAQPQLRERLFQLVPLPAEANAQSPELSAVRAPADGPSVESEAAAPYTAPSPAELPWLSPAPMPKLALASEARAQPMNMAGGSPLEHFEAFSVSVPANGNTSGMTDAQGSRRVALYAPADRTTRVATNVSPTASVAMSTGMASDLSATRSANTSATVPSDVARYAPTRLTADAWNVAAAEQSRFPLGGWTSARPADAAYRDTYPPPFGTQSQWK
jgi:hypothetical protein